MVNVVVLGAGVSGLTSALLLSRDKNNVVTVVAKHMPGDYDPEYTSPWAGANVLPMASEKDSRWEKQTWPELARLAREVPASGISFQKSRVYRRKSDLAPAGTITNPLSSTLFSCAPWYRNLMPSYREIPPAELPADIQSACEFTSVCINPAIYLPWLVGQCIAQGVVFRRATVAHICDATHYFHDQFQEGATAENACARQIMVVNCTGFLASKLGGVMDTSVVPARGQIVVVGNSAGGNMTVTSGTEDGGEELLYVMERPGGGGTVLGGTYQKGDWNAGVDFGIAARIMRRAVEFCPELVAGEKRKNGEKVGVEGLDVIRHGVGFRPVREGGVRLEYVVEERGDGDLVSVVHNYGHAGWGYQGSYGCAERVVELVLQFKAHCRAFRPFT